MSSRTKRFVLVGLVAAGMLLPNAPTATAATSPNLIKNPGGDAAPGGGDGYALVTIPNWARTQKATTVKYSAGGGFPTPSTVGPTNRGVAFFAGGEGPNSTLTQSIPLSTAHVNKIKTGAVKLNAEAWFGGFEGQADSASMVITLTQSSGSPVLVTVAGATAAQRGHVTKFVKKSVVGRAVPKNTTKISVQLKFKRVEGTYNDGYVDSTSLVLTGV